VQVQRHDCSVYVSGNIDLARTEPACGRHAVASRSVGDRTNLETSSLQRAPGTENAERNIRSGYCSMAKPLGHERTSTAPHSRVAPSTVSLCVPTVSVPSRCAVCRHPPVLSLLHLASTTAAPQTTLPFADLHRRHYVKIADLHRRHYLKNLIW
jgi:hypothetical protein